MTAGNVDRLRTIYEHWSVGDFRSDAAIFGRDFEWRQGPDAVEPATHRGPAGVSQMTRGVFEVFENFRIVPSEFIDAGDHVVVVSRILATAKATGLELDRPYIQVWTFSEGEPISVADYAGREAALSAAGIDSSRERGRTAE